MGFSSFVILAGMRTGSNFLEANLNSFDDIDSYGELFNPHFVGQHNKEALFGITLDQRAADPFPLLHAIKKSATGLAGFRLFADHDVRVLDYVLGDPDCAKIVLTRNPVESYVSRKIATTTGQWKLSDLQKRKEAKITFEPLEFRDHLESGGDFLKAIKGKLQRTGQSAFHISYEDVGNVEILNGLARFLGSKCVVKTVSNKTKKQNPSTLSEKVLNYSEMVADLEKLDHFGLEQTVDFERQRGPVVPSYIAAHAAPLLYLPISNGLEFWVADWLARLDSVSADALQRDFTQKSLRSWKKDRPGYRSFTVLRHPLARAYHAFCATILNDDDAGLEETKKILTKRYQVEVPDQTDAVSVRESFSRFLVFLKGNLSGQTSLRVDATWASQSALLDGFCAVQAPDNVFREADIVRDLKRLAGDFGYQSPAFEDQHLAAPFELKTIYDESLEKQCFQAYRKDYISFGFSNWAAD